MKIEKKDLEWAAEKEIISAEQASLLWDELVKRDKDKPSLVMSHVLYYFGALIVIAGMSVFIGISWMSFTGLDLFIITGVMMAGFAYFGWKLWFKYELKIPGGLLTTIAVCLTPLAVYGLEKFTGIWPQGDPGTYQDYHIWVRGSWIIMEMATLLVGFIALKFIRFPFITMPIGFTLWYMSMDVVPILFGKNDFNWDERAFVSAWFGMAIIIGSYIVDRRTKEDFAFWGYLFGLITFWGGLGWTMSHNEFTLFLYCLVNIFLMALSILLQRRVFMVFGGIGVFGYLGHLAFDVYENFLLFTFILVLLGVLLIVTGILYQKNEKKIREFVVSMVPPGLKRLMPTERGAKTD